MPRIDASFASVSDLLIAEPGALIGFAGPRGNATTIKKELPKGFQRAEFLLEKGQIDRIVQRNQMRDELARLLAYATGRDPVAAFKPAPAAEKAEGEVAPVAEAPVEAPKKKGRKAKTE